MQISVKRNVGIVFSFLVAVCFVCTLPKSPAHVYSDTNGQIAYASTDGTHEQIYVIAADGTGKTQLTSDTNENGLPRWSPDGTKIAYNSFGGAHTVIKTMNADGTNQVAITDGLQDDFLPTWSPDGTKLAFASDNNLDVMNADGSNRHTLTSDPSFVIAPSWKPDGSSILYTCDDGSFNQVCSINADGTGQRQITHDAHDHDYASWSPDSSKILIKYSVSLYNDHLATMNPDGSNIQVIATSDNDVSDPTWSPDGTKILFDNFDSVNAIGRVYTINADGTGETAVTPNDGNDSGQPSWQPIPSGDKDNDNSSNTVEAAGPNNGDANGDGLADKLQANVTGLVNPVSGKYTVLQSDCTANSSVSASTTPSDFKDGAFSYPEGLLSFTLRCASAGDTATVTQYYFGLSTSSSQLLRKYNPTTHQYQSIPGAVISAVTIGGQAATKATYQITDGGALDLDGTANGVIIDPVGIAAPAIGAPNTGFGGTAR